MSLREITKEEMINKIGHEVSKKLRKHYELWGSALPYRLVIPNLAVRIKQYQMTAADLCNELEDQEFLRVLTSPNGTKYCFPVMEILTQEEMLNWLQESDSNKADLKKIRQMQNSKDY